MKPGSGRVAEKRHRRGNVIGLHLEDQFKVASPGVRGRETGKTPGRFRQAAALALGLLLAAGWLGTTALTGCGRTPPEPFWDPTAEDTTAITGWVEANKARFQAAFSEDALVPCDTFMPFMSQLIIEIKENPYKQRVRHNALQYAFDQEGYIFKPSFIATIDTVMKVAGGETTWVQETTATVTVAETIPGTFRIQAFSYTKYLRNDTLFPRPGETLVLQVFDSLFTPILDSLGDTTTQVVVKEFEGVRTDGAVLKKQNGAWQPWKLAGGSWLNAPTPGEAPYVELLDLVGSSGTVRLWMRPDTLGFGMQRFYTDEELPTFRRTDSLTISQGGIWIRLVGFDAPMGGYIYFPDAAGKYQRYEFFQSPQRNPKVPLDVAPGIYTLYATQTPIQKLYEVEGDRLELNPERSGSYAGTVWGIRIRVTD